MKTAIILHGMPPKEEYYDSEVPSPSNNHWLPWLQRQLLLKNILAQTIELPEPYEPVYEKWCHVFNELKVDEETMLIGHSCGAGFLIRWLSENKIKTGKVALVAPYLDPEQTIKSEFFQFQIDSTLQTRAQDMIVFYSSDDMQEIITSVSFIKENFPHLEMKEFSDKGHFTLGEMKTDAFPELLDWLLA